MIIAFNDYLQDASHNLKRPKRRKRVECLYDLDYPIDLKKEPPPTRSPSYGPDSLLFFFNKHVYSNIGFGIFGIIHYVRKYSAHGI